jgi:hypothetical protein
MGLAAATKFYPLALVPISIFHLKRWRERLEYLMTMVMGAVVTFLPFTILGSVNGAPSSGGISSPSSSLLLSIFGFLFNPDYTVLAINLSVIVGGVLLTLLTIRQMLSRDTFLSGGAYIIAAGLVAIVLITTGILAAVYPLTPA